MGTQKMKNVYDIKYEQKLCFIMADNEFVETGDYGDEIAVILYLYYIDTVEKYYNYIDNVPQTIGVYIVSSSKELLDKVKQYYAFIGRPNVYLIEKPNAGRDISGLLIASKEIILEHKYICFLHDKKEHSLEWKEDTDFWIENIWGNLLGSSNYIERIVDKLRRNEKLGILVPPVPVGEHFCAWCGYGWSGSFGVTDRLAQKLGLKCNLDITKPPITLSTALWFKTKALEKLFAYPWCYNDFDDASLIDPDYLSYGVERIFAYVAQDAGYLTGEVMSASYAERQNLFLQYSMTEIFSHVQSFFPFPTLVGVRNIEKNLDRLLHYVEKKQNIFLYGAGDMGRFCLSYLRKKGIEPIAFLKSKDDAEKSVDNLPVVVISEYEHREDNAIIITVAGKEVQKQMMGVLQARNINHYFVFWM